MSMTTKPDPCPFCGSADAHDTSSGEGVVYVECAECGASGCSSDSVDGAVSAWNERARVGGVPPAWQEFVERVSKQKPEKPDYWSSCGQCEHNISDAEDLLAAAPAATQPAQAVQSDWRRTVGRMARALEQCADHAAPASYPATMREVAARLNGLLTGVNVPDLSAPQPEAQPHITEAQWREVFSEAAHASVLAVDELQARSIRSGVDKLLAAPSTQAEPPGKHWHAHHVAVNKAALQMVRNALRTDAEAGKQSRAEMLEELDKATFAIPAQAEPIAALVDESERLRLYDDKAEQTTAARFPCKRAGCMAPEISCAAGERVPGDCPHFPRAPAAQAEPTVTVPLAVLEAASGALGNFVSDHGWGDADMQAMDNLDAYIARHKAEQKGGE